ncbi:hypothetical protein BDAP_000690 [Binucleata daphniae]
MCLQCSLTGLKTKITEETGLACGDGLANKKAKLGDESYMIQYNHMVTLEYYVQSYFEKYSEKTNSIVPGTSQKAPLETRIDQVCLQPEYIRETEIFNNNIQQQINEVAQDAIQKIETCKNIKKNTPLFLELTEETKKLLVKQLNHKDGKVPKINDIKDKLIKNDSYKSNIFIKKDVIETFNLAKYIPDCLSKYACNKKIYEEQTQTIKSVLDTGFIDFDMFFSVLEKEIEYDNHDKEILAKLVDVQMNDFLHTNIDSLTLLFPMMQFFIDYYNKYQDNLVFFENTKHVCMVYGMMHIFETILKCTEDMVNVSKKINEYLIKYSNGSHAYKRNQKNLSILYFLATKFELEKILLYILQSFLPTDHFVDLVNLFHIELICSFGIYRHNDKYLYLKKPSKFDSIMLVLSTYCYIYFDALETDTNGIQQKVIQIFFRHLLNKKHIARIFFNRQDFYILQDVLVFNNCFIIFIRNNLGKLSDNINKAYIKLAEIHNQSENNESTNKQEHDDNNCLGKEVTNSDNKTNNSNFDDKKSKRKMKRNIINNELEIDKYKNYNSIVFYILNCMCNYIIACEATILMSYDITSDISKIEEVIIQNMEIIENWTNTKYLQKKRIDTDLSFKKPKFQVYRKKKVNKIADCVTFIPNVI